ncbi:alginate regulatory protein [Caloranaerobacter azorensis H53214]|uniref:Alginate regulatory protein n=1 Tax=Caloranaerobacter azorensis H53214 TaxID=1156417 RepID=A0A096BF59_9FIRM|nr:MBOAT family O-acyltransferase [Caloranaerobacter azorensis]KGG79835.1 alginate regulatory protein [Caloranaerobacter azorensis H53214]
MVFSSLTFLFIFLPVTLTLYFISPKKFKNVVLLITSLIFYAWGEPIYIFLMIFSSIVDYFHGLLIEKFRNENKKAKFVVLSSVVINLGLLSFFKYSDFLIDNFNHLFNTGFDTLDLPLPIGISFYTFQTMSYTIDVYRKEAPVQRSPLALATYVTLFPQLIAGPIVRYQTVAEQINDRKETIDKFADGVKRFIIGLGKKVLLANNIGMLWSEIQATNINDLTILTAWLGVFAFSFQIYFDFSGYSDMAIGLGKMFGFDFLENFNYPYISQSITEFWRRWHISLGTWFKDYVYVSLGGNKVSKIKMYRNLFIVWFLTGLWHGASWNFIVWGLYFGIIIAIEKAGLLKILEKTWKPIRHIYTIFLILVGWIFFVFDDISLGIDYLKVMFGIANVELFNTQFLFYLSNYIILFIILIISATPFMKNKYIVILNRLNYRQKSFYEKFIVAFIYFIILFISTAYLVDATYNPFLYFRF